MCFKIPYFDIRSFDLDKLIMFFSISYITIPIGSFFLGWLRMPLALLLCAVFIFFIYNIFQNICGTSIRLIHKKTLKYWILVIGICALWVYLSGIGGYCFQNADHFSRNAVFRDLSTCSWPIIYDLSEESEIVQQTLGNDQVALVYYFSWWLPISALSKLFHLGNYGRNFLLYFWALFGILLIIYCINRYLEKCTYLVPIILIFFSGLDIIPYYLLNSSFDLTRHIEWWASYFQYSSNTTQLFWVFNQTIPVWCICALLLQLKDSRYSAALCSLTFAYSAWAVFGMVPIALYSILSKKDNIRKSINICNLIIPLIMLVIYGSFYLIGNGSSGGYGIIFLRYSDEWQRVLGRYIIFLMFEVGVYFFIIGKHAHKYQFYPIILAECLLFPLFYIKDFDLCMRGSIPALFFLMIFVILFFVKQERNLKLRKGILIVILVIGAFTPFCEMNRSIQKTLSASSKEEILQEYVYSLKDIQTDNADLIRTVDRLFFAHNYNDTFFFRWLAK